MFPVHTLPFTLRLIMVHPCFVTSNDSAQEGTTFNILVIQILLADFRARFFMRHCELFWDPSCTNFMNAKSIVEDFIGRTMNNLQTIFHFINSQSSNRNMSCTCSVLSSVVAADRRPAPPSGLTFV